MRIPTITVLCVAQLAIRVAAAEPEQDRISTQQTGADTFEITFESKKVLDVENAIPRIAPTAQNLCGDRYIELGRYTFDANQAVTGSNSEDWFRLVQSIRCVHAAPDQPQSNRTPQLENKKAEEAVRAKVRQLSQYYFDRRYANLGDDADAALASTVDKGTDDSDTKSESTADTETRIDLFRLTVYDNLPNAPADGVYVAVDYDNSVGNVAHHCGYLMWHSFDAEEFSLGRVESGTLVDSMLASMSNADVYAVRKQLRCANVYDE